MVYTIVKIACSFLTSLILQMVNPIEIRRSLQNCDGTFCQSHVYILSISFLNISEVSPKYNVPQTRIVIPKKCLEAPPLCSLRIKRLEVVNE